MQSVNPPYPRFREIGTETARARGLGSATSTESTIAIMTARVGGKEESGSWGESQSQIGARVRVRARRRAIEKKM